MLEDVHKDMTIFSQVCEENRAFVLVMKAPIINHAKKLSILKQLFADQFNEISMGILEIITRKNRESVLPAIAREFLHQYNVHKGIQSAVITTAVPLDADLKKEFQKLLSEITDKKIDLNEEVDSEIIGGFKLTVGDKQVDDTIKSKLENLSLRFREQVYID